MAQPSRAQIEANVTIPKYKVYVWTPITYGYQGWQLINVNYVESISGAMNSSGTNNNAISFGSQVDTTASITFSADGFVNYVGSLRNLVTRELRIRIEFAFDTSEYVVGFEGPITDVTHNDINISITCGSYIEILKDFKLYRPVSRNRAISTKTTIATQENPDDISYVGGLLNEIFFRAGGRPLQQKGINYFDDSTFFFYSCDQSLFNSEWLWLSGDNLITEIVTLARAAGGQIYQDSKGTLRYIQPLNLVDGSTNYTYDTGKFETFESRLGGDEYANSVRTTFTPRRLEPVQDVYTDTTPRMLVSDEIRTFEFETTLPIYQWVDVANFQIFKSTYANGVAGYPTILIPTPFLTAQKVVIQVQNTGTMPLYIHGVTLRGRPVGAQDEQSAVYVSSFTAYPEKVIENNVYVQNEKHAKRLVRMAFDFFNKKMPIYTLTGVFYDPDRYVGELVTLNYPFVEVFNELCRIVAINHDLAGSVMDIDLLPIDTSLPKRSDMFIIGTNYAGSTVKTLSY